jgi:hypothetical protein
MLVYGIVVAEPVAAVSPTDDGLSRLGSWGRLECRRSAECLLPPRDWRMRPANRPIGRPGGPPTQTGELDWLPHLAGDARPPLLERQVGEPHAYQVLTLVAPQVATAARPPSG